MTDPYPWIPLRQPSRDLHLAIYPKRIDLKKAKMPLDSEAVIGTLCCGVFALTHGAGAVLVFIEGLNGEISGTLSAVLTITLLLVALFCMIVPRLFFGSLRPKSVKEAISVGAVPVDANRKIRDVYERINQIPGWDVVAAQDWADMCDLAHEAAAARSNDLTGPQELQAYNDAIRDYAAHIERKVVYARQIEKGAYTQDLDQHRAAAIRARAPQLEQNND